MSFQRGPARIALATAVCAFLSCAVSTGAAPLSAIPAQSLSKRASQQIQSLLAEKAARTPSERKMSSRLLYSLRRHRGKSFAPGLEPLARADAADAAGADGRVRVDIEALPRGTKAVIEKLVSLRAEIIHASIPRGAVRAVLAIEGTETLAQMPEVLHVRLGWAPIVSKVNTSEGDVAHRVQEARALFGVTGDGVRIGVLSNGLGSFEGLQGSGDLPAVTVLPGQEGFGVEGSAMLEVVHDLAPDAQLYFATGVLGRAAYAENIRKLREAGCDVLVDDLTYLDESPFQDGDVARAVQAVVDDGALYFSAVGNDGNKAHGTASTWEGDFADGGTLPLLGAGRILDFGGSRFNEVVGDGSQGVTLHWADPAGRSANDYDLFILDESLSEVLDFSTDEQNGDDDAFEGTKKVFLGDRIVVLRNERAESRFLRLSAVGGPLRHTTGGCARGHSAAAGAFAVAAVDIATAKGGAFTGGAANPVETFVCDGPRRIFFHPDGTPVTPGDFSSTGGEVRQKPDLTAADGGVTATRGFERFFGTSAAAPQAAGIAGLARAIFPGLTAAQFRDAVASTALDIDAPGDDPTSGVGILMALPLLEKLGAKPAALLKMGRFSMTELTGDGDTFVEPGETLELAIELRNIGGGPGTAISAALTSPTPGVSIVEGAAEYPALSPATAAANPSRFIVRLDPGIECGVQISFHLTVTYQGGNAPQQGFDLKLFTGKPQAPATFSYRGRPVAVPDSTVIGEPGPLAELPIVVQGLQGRLLKLSFRIDGRDCTTAVGSRTVGVDHPFVTDLTFTLQSPAGTVVKLFENIDLSGNNFCQMVLDDEAPGRSVLRLRTVDAPFSGTFKPQNPLAAFKGEDPNGTWILRATDSFPGDTGHLRAVSLIISAAGCEAEACDAGGQALLLQGGRFKVDACFKDPSSGNAPRPASPARVSDQSGLFWFFSPENPELLVKVLDGTAFNGRYWAFAGALSNLDYILKFTDTATGRVRLYHNSPGGLCGFGDTVTFPAEISSKVSALAACAPGALDLCLIGGRFRVRAHWRDRVHGLEGEGYAIPGSDQSGLFWFFQEGNVELGVKIVDGRPVSGNFWLFHGAMTDLEYSLEVTDTMTGVIRSYAGRGASCGGVDTSAF